MKMRRGIFALLPALLVANGCALGPDYRGPPTVAGADTSFVRRADAMTVAVPAVAWWSSLNDPELDRLIARALSASPEISVAVARLRQARAEVSLQFANLMPSGSAGVTYAHVHLPATGELLGGEVGSSGGDSSDFSLYADSFDATWEIDVWGGKRRALEAAAAQRGNAAANLADAQVSLSAEVANAYINLRDRQQRVALTDQALAMLQQSLDLTQQRFDRGTTSRIELRRVENQLETTRAMLPPLQSDADSYLDELATLAGQVPGALDAELRDPAPVPLPPEQVAVGDPATLLQRRPDVRAAERTLASDTAKIGQAEAARFPTVKLLGFIGLGGSTVSALVKTNDYSAILSPQISWSFLDFGRNRARVREAEGVREEAEAQYREAVLGALRDAENSLAQFGHGRTRVATLARAKAAADDAVVLASERYHAGTIALTDLLDAQRQQISAEQDLSQATAMLSSEYVSVNKALGLGWGNF